MYTEFRRENLSENFHLEDREDGSKSLAWDSDGLC
jgi:hypothetical protein